MMLGWWRLRLWMGLLLVVAVTAGSVAFVFYSRDRDSAGALVTMLVVVVTAGSSAAAVLWGRAQFTEALAVGAGGR